MPWTMITVTALIAVGMAVRTIQYWDEPVTPILALDLTLAAALTIPGSTFGGTLAFDSGFNVATAGDHALWYASETDVFPSDRH